MAFNEMTRRRTKLLAERSTTLAAIGHDLRSPMTAIRIRLEMIDDDETRERIEACLDEMETLVSATLALVQGVDGSEPLMPVALAEILREIAAELTESGGDVKLSITDEATTSLRRSSFKRAIRNIVESAVRYGSEARIDVIWTGQFVQIIIDDRGQGIPADQRERIFEPFVRLDEFRIWDTGGIGLGLAIARAGIESNGGRVVIEAAPTGGARVVVTFPGA